MITVGLATLGDGSRIGRSLAASGEDGIADVLAKEQRSFAVKTRVLDDLKLKPDLIKVDVEGGEYLVLAGARATLLAYMPIVVMELSKQNGAMFPEHSSIRNCVSLLFELGYCGWPVPLDVDDGGATAVFRPCQP